MNELHVSAELYSGGSDAAVMGSNFLTFMSGVARQDQRFIKDSMRLAEYRADLRYNRKQSSADWFEYYSGVLWSIGWSLEHAPVIVVEKSFTGDVLDAWEKSLSGQLSKATVRSMRESFQLLRNDTAGTEMMTDGLRKEGDFRFSPAQYNFHKELEVVVTNVRLIESNGSSTYLFWNIFQTRAQLDIQSRRFVTSFREMDKHREFLIAAVREIRVREIELSTQA
ncbi:hypothetical protein HUW52_04220 [Pseudomonas sp. 43A]|jgi:hypothetical protein|uniref:hypothetical protein n=1 Tax=Pseudomonas TaxID=286 RepID=UPI00036415EE|nr:MULTISPECIES: hypothetical protein [Pseudomonas]QKV62125.1 hypothetical protein HUW52_04220 [Pseudomonas sp. 43A]QMW10861.1 hypothetical protein H3303_04220 [Pseudomonas sp. 29A]